MRLTPLQITMLLHYNAIARPYAEHDPEHANSPAVADQRRRLMEIGLLRILNSAYCFEVTDKGKAHIETLCNAPMPLQRWVSPSWSEE